MFLAFPLPANARGLLGWFRLQTWPPGFKNEVILPTVYTALTKKLRGCCASASKRIDLAFNLSGICARSSSIPASCHGGRAMNGLFHAEEASFGTGKRIAMVVVGMVLIGLALLAGLA